MKNFIGLLILVVLTLPACRPRIQPIVYGTDNCALCRMTITDSRFGAELVTQKGKVYKFDSVECLARFNLESRVPDGEIHMLLATPFQRPETLQPVETVHFLHSPDLHSPMGMDLSAFGKDLSREAVLNSFTGEILDWAQVLQLVKTNPHPSSLSDSLDHRDTR